MYEDNTTGKVTDEWFIQLSHKYEVERMELKMKITEFRERLNSIGTMQQNKEQFIRVVRRSMEMKTLTVPLLRELIEKISVHETEGAGKNLLRTYMRKPIDAKNRVSITQIRYEHSIWCGKQDLNLHEVAPIRT